jgi:hypothetical protein
MFIYYEDGTSNQWVENNFGPVVLTIDFDSGNAFTTNYTTALDGGGA